MLCSIFGGEADLKFVSNLSLHVFPLREKWDTHLSLCLFPQGGQGEGNGEIPTWPLVDRNHGNIP